jgi:hypothetical protein
VRGFGQDELLLCGRGWRSAGGRGTSTDHHVSALQIELTADRSSRKADLPAQNGDPLRIFFFRTDEEIVVDDDAVTGDGGVCVKDGAPQYQLTLNVRAEDAQTAAEAGARPFKGATAA